MSEELKITIENLSATAKLCVDYVGHANYKSIIDTAQYALKLSIKTGKIVDPEDV